MPKSGLSPLSLSLYLSLSLSIYLSLSLSFYPSLSGRDHMGHSKAEIPSSPLVQVALLSGFSLGHILTQRCVSSTKISKLLSLESTGLGIWGTRIVGKTKSTFLGLTKGWFPKGWFWRMFPRNENRNEGTFGCSPGTKNQNEGTFGCSPRTKTATRVHSSKPPFYETALLSPSELLLLEYC